MIAERAIKQAVKKRLAELGAYQHWPVGAGYGAPTLDCIGCYRGLYYAIETKRPGFKPTKRQLITMADIETAGGIVMVIDSLEAARAIDFDNYLETK